MTTIPDATRAPFPSAEELWKLDKEERAGEEQARQIYNAQCNVKLQEKSPAQPSLETAAKLAQDAGVLSAGNAKLVSQAAGGWKADSNKPRTDLLPWEVTYLCINLPTISQVPSHVNVRDTLGTLGAWWTRQKHGGKDLLEIAFAGALSSIFNESIGYPKALLEVAKVLAFGAEKYADRNWEKGIKYSRVYAAAMRHGLAWLGGESIDAETGLSHLAHFACCIMFLLTYEHRSMGGTWDDRP